MIRRKGQRIRAISFDASDTLFHLRRRVGEVYAEVATEQGSVLDPDALEAAFRAVWKERPQREDGVRQEDDRGFWEGLLSEVLRRCGQGQELSGRLFLAAYERFCGAAEWELFPETRAVLADLAETWPLYVTSNYDGRLHGTLQALGVDGFFQKVIVSSEVGSDKPAPGIFAATQRAAGVAAGEILHVGDQREADWLGARRAGMAAWLVVRPQHSLSELRGRIESGDIDLPE